MQATNSVAGSSFLRTRSEKIQITAPNGEVVYHGPPTAEEIQNALAGEDEQIQAAIDAWLRRAVHSLLVDALIFNAGTGATEHGDCTGLQSQQSCLRLLLVIQLGHQFADLVF